MHKRILSGLLVAAVVSALASVSGADVVSTALDGTTAAAPSPSSRVVRPARPVLPAQPAQPGTASGETDGLERRLGDVAQGLDRDELRDLERDIDDELDEIELEFDERDADLEEQADDLRDIDHEDGVENSKELKAAEARLGALEDELDALDARLSDIGRRARAALRGGQSADELRALIADARAFGAALDAFDLKIDDLDALVSAAEDQRRDHDDRRR